ncbi:MIX and LysM peptidoglycan-binding domain-containing protein [Vibrio parahaemolyticus]|uniref:MIX and LysM peptidoglycan-binding domain-containing protein n=1 Tax=Vibrio parahaemolyticus TaxID=670 RepID=UPI001F557EA1|nr:hypothetical protein [Vibrio parahaemolyticus]
MSYRVVRITELMAYEFGQVEGGFNELNENELKTAIPSGMEFKAFMEQLRQGHLVLLTDSPSIPMLLSESGTMGGGKTWSLNSQATDNVEPAAQSALLARTRMSGSSAGYCRNHSLHPPLPMPTYVPEPPRPDYSDESPKLKYEYSFEIACSQDSVRQAGSCHFILTKTKNEVELGRWVETKTEHGTRYTIQTAFDEPKRLVAQVASRPMGISPTHSVKVRNIGAQVANEGFIPVTPTVQLGERLGFPTEGFYYHFHDNQLVQEYRLQGDQRWSFYATLSRHQRLDPERGFNTDQTAILVFWKLGGKVVENQYLVYLERQITRDELDSLTDDWLNEHGVKLDIPQLLEATKHPIIKRSETAKPAEQKQPEPVNHIVQTDPETGTRETWAKIANQYGIAPKALLDLNPQYDADPMSLSVGASLNVQKQKPSTIQQKTVYAIPPEPPKKFNHPLNTFYDYTGRCLVDTSIVSINHEGLVEKDIPVVNIKTVSDVATEFELGFTQVEQTQPLDNYWQSLFSSETSEDIKAILKKYNTHLNNPVRQGEIVVIPTKEPTTETHRSKLDTLIVEAKAASAELAKLTEEQVATVNRHFELLDYYACEAIKKIEEDGLPTDLYADASIGVGAVAAGVEQHLKNINGVLLEINHLYVSQVAMASRVGSVNYGSFVAERASLFKKLDGSFAALSKRNVQIPVYTQIRRNLKLSTRSIIHNADEIIAKGIVPNLGKRMANVAIGIITSRGVGYVGLVLGAASGAKNIYDACSVDGSGECGKKTTREIGGFLGGWLVGAQTGQWAASGTLLVLGVVGITSAPVLAIASIGAFVVGGAAGGVIGATIGKSTGDIVYEKAIELTEATEALVEDLF